MPWTSKLGRSMIDARIQISEGDFLKTKAPQSNA